MSTLMISVPEKHFRELEAKERAHDDYLAGLKALKQHAAAIELEARGIREQDITADYASGVELLAFAQGYRRALNDIALAIVIAAQARHDGELVHASLPDAATAWK